MYIYLIKLPNARRMQKPLNGCFQEASIMFGIPNSGLAVEVCHCDQDPQPGSSCYTAPSDSGLTAAGWGLDDAWPSATCG